jgi:hypothetical protein
MSLCSDLAAHALPVAAQDVLAANSAGGWAKTVATNVDIHIASASAPSASVIDVDSRTAVHSAPVAPPSPDIDVDISAAAAFAATLPAGRALFARAHLRASI